MTTTREPFITWTGVRGREAGQEAGVGVRGPGGGGVGSGGRRWGRRQGQAGVG